MQDCLLQAFQETDKAGAGHLAKHNCLSALKGLASDLLHLTPQASHSIAQHMYILLTVAARCMAVVLQSLQDI